MLVIGGWGAPIFCSQRYGRLFWLQTRLASPARPVAVNQPTRTNAPPSTGSATPVMKLASSEARNRSCIRLTSYAVPIRPRSGTLASRSAATSARLRLLARARVSMAIGVSMSSGKMQLARMPYEAFCKSELLGKGDHCRFRRLVGDERVAVLARSHAPTRGLAST